MTSPVKLLVLVLAASTIGSEADFDDPQTDYTGVIADEVHLITND